MHIPGSGYPNQIGRITQRALKSAASHLVICSEVPDNRFDLHLLLERSFKSRLPTVTIWTIFPSLRIQATPLRNADDSCIVFGKIDQNFEQRLAKRGVYRY